MKKRYPKRVNPHPMLTRFEEIFKSVGMKNTDVPQPLLHFDSDQCCQNVSDQ